MTSTIKMFCFSVFILASFIVKGQQANTWYFGRNAGLDFNYNPPQPLTNSLFDAREGCSTISDRFGRFLFYSNGIQVYDRNFAIMPNGNGLLGNKSTTDGPLIIPKPGDSNIYFIITADCAETFFVNGYRYSALDMRLNGGLGDLTSEKNVLLYTPSTEKLTAVKHSNGIDYWLVTKQLNNNRFNVYRIDCNGINTNPIVSNTGAIHVDDAGHTGGTGSMRLSPNGKKLAVAIGSATQGQIQLFDFNTTTGIISNPIDLDGINPGNRQIYGAEFSFNNKVLYISGSGNKLYQYDISSNNQILINASRNTFYNPTNNQILGLQLGPDKKIYVSIPQSSKITIINNPEIMGAGCNLALNSLDLNGGRCVSGLPTYVPSLFDTTRYTDFNFSFVDCYVKFNATSNLTGTINWAWDFGDGTTGTGQTINHSFRRTGTFNVTLNAYLTSGCGLTDSLVITKPVTINNVFSVDYGYAGGCVNQPVQFSDSTILTIGNITGHTWDFGDNSPTTTAINPIHTYTTPGVYNVKLLISTSGICRADSIIKQVYIDSKPVADFNVPGGCMNKPLNFTDASTNSTGAIDNWLWDFGDAGIDLVKNPVHTYSNFGTYPVKLTVTSARGCKTDITKPVVIESIPVADFEVTVPCVNQSTGFIDHSTISSGTITNWLWNFDDVGSSAVTQNTSHTYNNTGTYQVSLIATSVNGCASPAKIISVNIIRIPAFAGRDTIAVYDEPIQLQASGGISYLWQPGTGLNNPAIANPVAVLRNEIVYSVQVTSAEGCIQTDDILVKVFSNFDVFVPNSFTPNGDGINETLKPLGKGLARIEFFKIYNRYGELLFESRDVNKGWDGNYKGKKQPAGNYIYIVRAIDIMGRVIDEKGSVLIIR